MNMQPVAQVAQQMESAGLGFERIKVIQGSTFQDASTVVVIPTRGMINHKVVASWQNLISPMNQKRALMFAAGDEVGVAYNRMISEIISNPQFNSWRYLLTLEDDNIVPADTHIRLLETIESGPKWDAVSAIYFTKGDFNAPMAYGSPEEYERTGVLDFRPRDIREALAAGECMPVNGIAMGAALWRLDMFRELPAPWFVTCADVVPEKGVQVFTQDLFFCRRAREAGKRFCVDLRCHVGHLDINSGIVY
jgi:hypothetical protein